MVYDAEDVKEEAHNWGGPSCPSSQFLFQTRNAEITSNKKRRMKFSFSSRSNRRGIQLKFMCVPSYVD